MKIEMMTSARIAVIRARCRVAWAIFIVANWIFASQATADQWRFEDAERVVAISDVHGAFDAMVRTLASAGVIDDGKHWIAGGTHLVITGDLLDRGPDSRKVMDLVMRLEGEALDQGGRVHQLLGNHEVMNLVGDLRYVARAEYLAFAADESEDERAAWFARFNQANGEAEDSEALRNDFDEKAPPGFFAHRAAFRADGQYGRWLLEKPLLVVVNDTAFVHGGLSPLIAEIGLDGVNGRLAGELREYVTRLAELNDAGILNPIVNFYDHADRLQALQDGGSLPAEFAAAATAIVELSDSDIHTPDGPLWYRGSVGCGPLIETDRLDAVLSMLGADRVVIGHTPTRTRRVLERLGGRVLEIDTGMLNAAYQGSGNALIIAGDTLQVVNEASPEHLSVMPHPRRVGQRADDISAEDLESLLAHGEIVAIEEDFSARTIVDIAAATGTVRAVFAKNPRKRGFVPELAAYRLDRALELNMVPVTVAREVKGDAGTLQFLATDTTDESQRRGTGRGGSAWCPLQDQWAAMYVFDALIFNPGRPPQNIVYSQDNWQLILTGHDTSFSTKRGRPPYLQQIELAFGDTWRESLVSLDDDALATALAGVLDKRRLSALAKRRDALLE